VAHRTFKRARHFALKLSKWSDAGPVVLLTVVLWFQMLEEGNGDARRNEPKLRETLGPC